MTLRWPVGRFAIVAVFAGATAASMLFWQSALHTSAPSFALPHPFAGSAGDILQIPSSGHAAPGLAAVSMPGRSILLAYRPGVEAIATPVSGVRTRGSRSLPATGTLRQPPTPRTTPVPQPSAPASTTSPPPVTPPPTVTPVAAPPVTPAPKPATRNLANAHSAAHSKREAHASAAARSTTGQPAASHPAQAAGAQQTAKSPSSHPKKRDPKQPSASPPAQKTSSEDRAQPPGRARAGGKTHPVTPTPSDASQQAAAQPATPPQAQPGPDTAPPSPAQGRPDHGPPPGKGHH